MAIYHCSVKIISRSSGRSATAAAAYRAGEEIEDARTGLVHDYSRKGGVDYSAILAPKHAPDWVKDRATLWNKVEQVEKRKDSQLCREVEVAIPRELTIDQKKALVICFANSQFVGKGMVADVNIHHIEGDNPHAHILLTTREITPDGFGQKNREWNDKEQLIEWRQEWEYYVNDALTMAGFNQKVDHRTLEAQNIDRIPTIHLGPNIIDMERRGKNTDLMARANRVKEDNQRLQELRQQRTDIYIQKINVRHEILERQRQNQEPADTPKPEATHTLQEIELEIARLRQQQVHIPTLAEREPAVEHAIQDVKALEKKHWQAAYNEESAQREIKMWREIHTIRAKSHDAGIFQSAHLVKHENLETHWRREKNNLAKQYDEAKKHLAQTRKSIIERLEKEQASNQARIDDLMVIKQVKQREAAVSLGTQNATKRVASNARPHRQAEQDHGPEINI